MKWKAMLVFFLFLLCQNLLSQFYWQKTYNSYIGGDDEGYDGCAADGSNFYVVGYTGIFNYYMYVAKLNQLGDTLWTRTFFGGIADAVAPSNDGGCVFTGRRNNCFSMKLDLNGNVVWDRTYPNGAETRDIAKTGDSGYVMCGGFFSGYVCKLDTQGNLQWERYYSDALQDFHAIDLALDGGYVVGGRKIIEGIWKSYFMKIDVTGNVVWETSFPVNNIIKSFVKNGDNYVISMSVPMNSLRNIILIKVNSYGSIYDTDTLSRNPDLTGVRDILLLKNNKLVITGYTERQVQPFGYVGKVISIDTNAKILKELTIVPDTNSQYLYSLMKAPGSNLDDIICIGSAEPNSPHDMDLYIARLDSSLNEPPTISVSIISSIIPSNHELMQNFPNPFNGQTIIEFRTEKRGFVQIKIFDILGKEVDNLVSVILPPGKYSKAYWASKLTSGVYFYQLEFDEKVIKTQKMIYIK